MRCESWVPLFGPHCTDVQLKILSYLFLEVCGLATEASGALLILFWLVHS